jgi:antitoxin component YwqK of YwqJK toxin-antitoxin module
MNFVQGVPDGKFKTYYGNGYVREEGVYSMGSREKNLYKYDMQGTLYLTITYKNDKETKLNGVKIKLPKGTQE